MQIILLSGGSGKRLWPLSNNTRSKQFIKLLTAPDGSKESMVQRVVRQLRETGICDSITVATSQSQRDIIINQLGEEIPVVTEPERRDTFPAIALASSYLAYKRKCSTDEIIIVMPCDPYTETGYFETIRRIADAVKNNVAELVLMGINPTYPSAKYGYVVPVNDVQNKGIFQVSRFTEKPDMITAEKLISEGAFWNGGVFAFRLGYMTDFTCKKLLMTKKKLPVRFTGQHFTIDKVLIKDAIRQANISNQDTVLDIGAGKGFLTVHLLKIANNVVAIENDTALVEHLRKLFSDARNVQVVGCDFRNFAVPKFPFKVVSNIPYGITSDIFKILMFESLGNFLGGSIVLQLEPTQKLFSRKLYNPYTVFYHTFFDLKLVYEVGPESFLPPPTVKSALLNIKRKHLFFDFKFKAKYLAFISCLLEKPDLSVKTALKSIFRKSQVRSISEKFGLNLNAQIVCLSPSQWLNCFLEMLEVVPEKFHPS